MVVYVISKIGKPLMPTTPRKARLLLESGKAKCMRRMPFTIKLLYATTGYTQPLTHGVDTGSSEVGSAVADGKGNIVYMSQVEIRNDISVKMTRRSKYRGNRRNRKTRYRQARWLNRRNSIKKDRFSPTMKSKFDSHEKEAKFVRSILPITSLIIETATFDPHALKNPEVLKNKLLYQRGVNYGYANTRAYVLDRDGHACRHCKGKSKDNRLEAHHIVYRSDGGPDDESNLVTLCKECHGKVHSGVIKLKPAAVGKPVLRHATQMNSIRIQLLKRLDARETFGYITKEHRQMMNLEKEHYYDAVAIACLPCIEKTGSAKAGIKTDLLLKKCIADGDYQQTKGVRSEQRIPTRKMQGFKKFDKVGYHDGEYFIKGRMATGYAILMDINGEKAAFKPIPKMSLMKRVGARKTWIMCQKTIQNTACRVI